MAIVQVRGENSTRHFIIYTNQNIANFLFFAFAGAVHAVNATARKSLGEEHHPTINILIMLTTLDH